MQPQRNTSFVTVIACAVLFLFVAAPAALAAPPTGPNFPSAVPSQPGMQTGLDRASNAARAQERYYSSHSTPAPLSQPSNPVDDGGIDWSAIGIALGGSCLIIGAGIGIVTRRRQTARVRVAA